MSVKSHLGIDWPVLIPFSEESDEASRSRRRRRSDDGMKVVINNWREDGEKEWTCGTTMDCLIRGPQHTDVPMWYCMWARYNRGDTLHPSCIMVEEWTQMELKDHFQKIFLNLFFPRTQQFLQLFGGDYLNNVNVGCIYKQERWWL